MSDLKNVFTLDNTPVLSEDEKKALEKTANLWNHLVSMDQKHPDDLNDLRHHIHAIQNIIFTRPWLNS